MLSEDYDKVVCKEQGVKKNHVHLLLTYIFTHIITQTSKKLSKYIHSCFFVQLKSQKNCRMNDYVKD